MDLSNIFHAYDVRGTYPDQFDEAKAKRIAGAYVRFTGAKTVAVGRDVRLSGPKLQKAVADGLREAGANVIDIGPVPTDGLYFAVGYYHYDGGIQVSASHNPAEFNGLKFVKKGVDAISGDSGLKDIQKLAESDDHFIAAIPGELESKDIEEDYLDFLTKFAHFETGRSLKVVANSNFGLTGIFAQKLLARLSTSHVQLIELNFTPDGNFPKGRPDPLRVENRQETSDLVVTTKADLGVAWDADGDRFFVTDEKGQPVESCYLAALLASYILQSHPGEKIVYDPRTVWVNTKSVEAAGGKSVISKAGHAFYKNRMREEDAVFGGELSGHFFFRDFYFADSGPIPFLMVLNIVSSSTEPVSEIIRPLQEKYFVSGEINFEVEDKAGAIKIVEDKYADGKIDRTDGLSISLDDWRLNLRASNTENLLRLNLEAKSREVCDQKTAEVSALIS